MLIDALARLILPAPVVRALDVAQEIPAAVEAARATYDAGGPLAALRAFADATDNALDDAAVAEIEALLRRAIDGLDRVCAVGAWVAEHETETRAAVDAVLAGVYGLAYRAASWRYTLRGWVR